MKLVRVDSVRAGTVVRKNGLWAVVEKPEFVGLGPRSPVRVLDFWDAPREVLPGAVLVELPAR